MCKKRRRKKEGENGKREKYKEHSHVSNDRPETSSEGRKRRKKGTKESEQKRRTPR